MFLRKTERRCGVAVSRWFLGWAAFIVLLMAALAPVTCPFP